MVKRAIALLLIGSLTITVSVVCGYITNQEAEASSKTPYVCSETLLAPPSSFQTDPDLLPEHRTQQLFYQDARFLLVCLSIGDHFFKERKSLRGAKRALYRRVDRRSDILRGFDLHRMTYHDETIEVPYHRAGRHYSIRLYREIPIPLAEGQTFFGNTDTPIVVAVAEIMPGSLFPIPSEN